MVCEYSPDPPGEEPQEIKPVLSLQNEQLGDSNTESEEENEFGYDGYEPIPMGPELEEITDENEEDGEIISVNIPNLPTVPSIEDEILKEVWSAPSETSIPMDAAKVDQIKNAMANFTLPPSSIPEWAIAIPDEDIKNQLVDLIKQQKKL